MSFYDIDLVRIDDKAQKMDVYRSKTLLVVNVASECGFTPQYAGPQTLYDRFMDRGYSATAFAGAMRFAIHRSPVASNEVPRLSMSKQHCMIRGSRKNLDASSDAGASSA
jgi:glutathione peroxidase-family protein